jgi:hypothetical protein
MCVVLDNADVVCEILNIRMTDRLISQVWPAGEHLIYKL